MNEPAAYAIRAGAESVEGLADLSLVLGMADNRALFMLPVGELALHSIAAGVSLHERAAEFSLVEIWLLEVIIIQ